MSFALMYTLESKATETSLESKAGETRNMPNDQHSGSAIAPILYFVDKEYQKTHPDILNKIGENKTYLEEVLQTAMRNKLSYPFSREILSQRPDLANQKIMTMANEGKKRVIKVKETLEFVSALFNEEGLDFLFIKTFKGLPHITWDVDVIVKDFQQAAQALKSKGASESNGRFLYAVTKLHLGLPHYRVKGLLNIDLYKGVPWHGLSAFNDEFLWESPRLVDLYGVKCLIPSYEADLLSLLASSLFTDGKLTLLDFLYINSLFRMRLDFDELLLQIEKYGWRPQFVRLISIIRLIQQAIYQTEQIPKCIKFPYTIPVHLLFRSFHGPIRHKVTEEPRALLFTLMDVGFRSFVGRVYGAGIDTITSFFH